MTLALAGDRDHPRDQMMATYERLPGAPADEKTPSSHMRDID